MCLKIRNGKTKPKVADSDIVCYKVLVPGMTCDTFYAPLFGHVYCLGTTDYIREDLFLDLCDDIASFGFHSFTYQADAFNFIGKLCEINRGNEDKYVVCQCTIPKGAKYYKGGHMFDINDVAMPPSYCSNTIRIDNVIEKNGTK